MPTFTEFKGQQRSIIENYSLWLTNLVKRIADHQAFNFNSYIALWCFFYLQSSTPRFTTSFTIAPQARRVVREPPCNYFQSIREACSPDSHNFFKIFFPSGQLTSLTNCISGFLHSHFGDYSKQQKANVPMQAQCATSALRTHWVVIIKHYKKTHIIICTRFVICSSSQNLKRCILKLNLEISFMQLVCGLLAGKFTSVKVLASVKALNLT